MKNTHEILKEIRPVSTKGDIPEAIGHIRFDSRKVRPGDMFVAIRGSQTDGHQFLRQADKAGAGLLVSEEEPIAGLKACQIRVDDSRESLGKMAAQYFGNPTKELIVIGVTGTNGKTTVATLLHQLFTRLGYACGLISTIENKIINQTIDASHTTPDPVKLQELFSKMKHRGCTYAFMEVSSHGIDQKRIAGIEFNGAIFTNISRDHLDYHGDFASYIQAKKAFFDPLPPNAFSLINADDRQAKVMIQNTRSRISTFALKTAADYRIKILENNLEGLRLQFHQHDFYSRLMGAFNAYNLLAVLGTALLEGQEEMEILPMLSQCTGAEGRLEYIQNTRGIHAFVDYAHSPDALMNILDTLQKTRTGHEQLITIMGAGGNRDKGKRPLMSKVASAYSDRLILTSDNPRNEDPKEILNDLEAGIPASFASKYLKIEDRSQAIKAAAQMAKTGDIILLAGKGHEKYQEILGVRYDFDDRKQLQQYLKS